MADLPQEQVKAPTPDLSHLATKEDLADVRSDLVVVRGDVAELRADLAGVRTRLEFMATKEDLAELRGEFAGLRGSLRMAGWFAGLVVGLLAVVAQIALFFLQRSLP